MMGTFDDPLTILGTFGNPLTSLVIYQELFHQKFKTSSPHNFLHYLSNQMEKTIFCLLKKRLKFSQT